MENAKTEEVILNAIDRPEPVNRGARWEIALTGVSARGFYRVTYDIPGELAREFQSADAAWPSGPLYEYLLRRRPEEWQRPRLVRDEDGEIRDPGNFKFLVAFF